MALEIELKFYTSNFDNLRDILNKKEGKFINKYLERNIVFDTQERSLRKSNILLRLRSADKNVLCLKKSPSDAYEKNVKVWEELQTSITNPEELTSILLSLGYEIAFRYEKFREKWKYAECTICLDILPFGKFIEIEGKKDKIFSVAARLGLNIKDSTTKTYHQLNQEYRKLEGLPLTESFVFDDYVID